jgi:hypothetical protein
MLGAMPKSGTAWRQTEALLTESYNLFEYMTENKGLALEDMFRTRIIPYLKTKIDHKDEITALLDANEITMIDGRYIKGVTAKMVNRQIIDKVLNEEEVTQEEMDALSQKTEEEVTSSLKSLGSQRFFAPDDISEKTWAETLDGMEWDLDIDVTGESRNAKDELTTLNTMLQVVMNPAFESNKKAQAIVGRILENTNTMSPIEYSALPSTPVQPAPAETPPGLPANTIQ